MDHPRQVVRLAQPAPHLVPHQPLAHLAPLLVAEAVISVAAEVISGVVREVAEVAHTLAADIQVVVGERICVRYKSP